MKKILVDTFNQDDLIHYESIWKKLATGDNETQEQAIEEYDSWCEQNYFLQCLEIAQSREDLTEEEQDVLKEVTDYYLKTWPKMAERTQAIIQASMFGVCEPFFSSKILRTHFGGEMSKAVLPEKTYTEGKIILIDFPYREYSIASIIANSIYKKLFQQTMGRRSVEDEKNPRPVFMFCDEYQYFVSPESDSKFQAACRDTMTAPLYATQSINSLVVAMGQDGGLAKAKSLLANLSIQTFCCQVDRDTNEYASNLIGKQFIETKGSSFDTNNRSSRSTGEQLHYIVPPEDFATLRCGGPTHKFKVDAIMVCKGKKWSTNEPFLEVTFDQRGPRKSFF